MIAPADLAIKEFRAMAPAEQRRAIVRDALAQLERGNYLSCSGVYLSHPNIVPNLNLRDLFVDSEPQVPCAVCALGACFVSAVRLDDDYVTAGEAEISLRFGDLYDKLVQFFTPYQIEMIEAAFEIPSTFDDFHVANDLYASSLFGRMVNGNRWTGSEDRLIAILQNIAADPEGMFRP
jgi:hypothetical protein